METKKRMYDKDFYQNNRNEAKLKSVDIVLAEVIKIIPQSHSAVDFGCATGTWLKGLEKYGITDIRGYDGKWVDKSKLLIPKECFFEVDFDKPIEIDRKFDLAISIEVAEHLQESSADSFIENLTKAADFVLFSAAIPYQGGYRGGANHINEQWPGYWCDKFNRFGYVCVDSIRK
ncbi:MAG: class I SAM-dependent methyltransferase, partial [Tannerella sp.]|nr:class I SAM-dependent methyltransferase [Tannerella sp.]